MPDETDEFIPTRWTLIERLKDWEDQQSWKDFFDTYWHLLYRTAARSGCTDTEAQEVVQETVISVAKQIPTFRTDPGVGSFKGWLLCVTRRRIVDQLRKRPPANRFASFTVDDDTKTSFINQLIDPMSEGLAEYWELEWQKNLVHAAIDRVKRQVKPQQFQIFYLLVIKQQAPRAVARTLGVNVAQVYLAKHRVSMQVKREVRRLEKDPIQADGKGGQR